MPSIWTATAALEARPVLQGDETADVCVIGGGMAGVLCARRLHDAGVDVALLEGDRIGRGTTGHTTAKVTSQHGLIYAQLTRSMGAERARQYYEANRRAIEAMRAMGGRGECGLETRPSFVYSLTDRAELENEVKAAQAAGAPASLVDVLPLPVRALGAVRFEDQAQCHPLQLLGIAADGLRIYERSFVHTLRGGTAFTDRGSLRAKAVVVATHFPFLNRLGGYFVKLYQHRSYVIALENGPDVQGMYLDAAENGLSFRDHAGMLLIGGGDHRTGHDGEGWAAPRSFAKDHYPDAVERHHWAAQDCMTLDGAPYIGHYAGGKGELYVATGFNKWGMTGSMVAAMLLEAQLTGRPSDCADAFRPERSMLYRQLFTNAAESALNWLAPRRPRCTHLGCALVWNPQEHSWDCPCHGSRFDAEGHVLENPAMKNR